MPMEATNSELQTKKSLRFFMLLVFLVVASIIALSISAFLQTGPIKITSENASCIYQQCSYSVTVHNLSSQPHSGYVKASGFIVRPRSSLVGGWPKQVVNYTDIFLQPNEFKTINGNIQGSYFNASVVTNN